MFRLLPFMRFLQILRMTWGALWIAFLALFLKRNIVVFFKWQVSSVGETGLAALTWIKYLMVVDISFVREGELTACGSGPQCDNYSESPNQKSMSPTNSGDFVGMSLLAEHVKDPQIIGCTSFLSNHCIQT